MKPAYQQHVDARPEMQLDDSSVQNRFGAAKRTRIGAMNGGGD
jgi:hypothetical protein